MAWTAFWVFLIDQATKWLVIHWLDLKTRTELDILPPVLNLRWAENRGVNFGLLADIDMRWVLVVVAVAISGFVVVWVLREGGSRLVHASAGLLVGGALGNVVDRVLYGYVADFLNMSCCGLENPWAFNVADIAVFLGAVGLVLFAGRGNGRDRRRTADPDDKPSAAKAESKPAPKADRTPAPKAEKTPAARGDGVATRRAARRPKTG